MHKEKSLTNNFVAVMQPYLEKINLIFSLEQILNFNQLGNAMLSDPMYPSVSKIFTVEEIALKHFLDSIIPIKFAFDAFQKSNQIVDLGTGAGFPLLPLAIMFPNKSFLGVDSRQKSVEFVARMAKKVGLNNVAVKHVRIEELGQNPEFREKSDMVICRALSALRTLLEYTMPLTRVGGYCFYYKGPKLDKELAEAANALKTFSVNESDMVFYSLDEPSIPFSRGYLQIQKKHPVPLKYPRKNGLPAAKPL